MTAHTTSADQRQRFRFAPIALACLAAPLTALAAPLQPSVDGYTISWPAASSGIDSINVHRDDGSYVTTLAATTTSWTAPEADGYFLVSVKTSDWTIWERSEIVYTGTDEPGTGYRGLSEIRLENGRLAWDAVPADWDNGEGYGVVGINVLRDGKYVTSINASATSWQPNEAGFYAIVYVLGNDDGKADWRDWISTNRVYFELSDDNLDTETTDLVATYDNYLAGVMPAVRGEHFKPFINSVLDALLLWDERQISADGLTNTGLESPSMAESVSTRSCDSGDVTRTVDYYSKPDPNNPTKAPLASMSLDFNACLLGDSTLEGKAAVLISGDSPSRLGGQNRREQIIFDAMSMTTDDGGRSLSGKYWRTASFSADSSSDIIVEYVTDSYTGPEFWAPVRYTNHYSTYRYRHAHLTPGQQKAENRVTESAYVNLADEAVTVTISDLQFDLSADENQFALSGGLIHLYSRSPDETSKRPYGYMVLDGLRLEDGFNMIRNLDDYTSGREFEGRTLWTDALQCNDLDGVFTDLDVCSFDR
ncbi:MAG: hypothetical protein CSB44_10665 [Gammaproteobacteria bacterium]|nr:MAG: hypothetical protein CSB44_10665 [Gammaproteobacteria bacterium]